MALTNKYLLLQRIKNGSPLRINLDEDEVIVGRKSFKNYKCYLHVSRKHASFQSTSAGSWFVKDLNSTNGVYVNGEKIGKGLHGLVVNDIISFACPAIEDDNGELEFTFFSRENDKIKKISSGQRKLDSYNISSKHTTKSQFVEEVPAISINNSASSTSSITSVKNNFQERNGDGASLLCKNDNLNSKETPSNVFSRPIQCKRRISPQIQSHASNNEISDITKVTTSHLVKTEPNCEADESTSFHVSQPHKHIKVEPKDNIATKEKDVFQSRNRPKTSDVEIVVISDDEDSEHSKSNSDHIFIKTEIHDDQVNEKIEKNIISAEEICANDTYDADNYINRASSTNNIVSNPLCSQDSSNANDVCIKKEPIEVVVKKEPTENVNQISFNDDEMLGYSQHDEVIVISDDEGYFNFSSLSSNGEDKVIPFVKTEPEDEVDIDFECDYLEPQNEVQDKVDELNMEEKELAFDEPNDYDLKLSTDLEKLPDGLVNVQLSVTSYKKDESSNKQSPTRENYPDENQKDEEFPESENILNIANFINKASTSDQTENTAVSSLDTTSKADVDDQPNFAEDFFPILSQNFYSETSNNEDYQPNKNQISHGTSSYKSKSSTTLLTDPKPMTHRPRCHRGREEWFEDRYYGKPSTAAVAAVKPLLADKPVAPSKRKPPLKDCDAIKSLRKEQTTKEKKPKTDLRKKLQSQMSHRIRAPNGGSAVPMASKGKDSSVRKHKVARQTETKYSLNLQKQKSKMYNISIQNHRTVSVKTRPEKFSSRMDFLCQPSISDPILNKKRKAESAETPFKIPKIPKKVVSNSPRKTNFVNKKDQQKSNEMLKDQSADSADQRFPNPYIPRDITKSCNNFIRPSSSSRSTSSRAGSFTERINHSAANRDPGVNRDSKKRDFANLSVPRFGSNNVQSSADKVSKTSNNINKTVDNLDPRLRKMHQPSSSENCSNNSRIEKPVIHVAPYNRQQTAPAAGIDSLISINTMKLSKKFDSVTLMMEILKHWNPSWMREYVNIGVPPSVFTKGLIKLPLNFNTLDLYAQSFYSLIRLELWEHIFADWRVAGKVTFLMFKQSMQIEDCMVLDCESVASITMTPPLREGYLLIVELRPKHRKEVVKIFGYISNVEIIRLNKVSLHKEWQKHPEMQSNDSVLYKFSLKTKKINDLLADDKLMKTTVVSYIASKLRLADTFQHLMSSSLNRCILNPTSKTFSSLTNNLISTMPLVGRYNSKQMDTIVSISKDMSGPLLFPRISLLQGPPGTGKTHTIIGIIQALLHIGKGKMKILVTASSNAAVDEIGRRLINLRKSHTSQLEKILKVVRIGIQKQIHPDMQPYSLDELAKLNSKRDDSKCLASLMRDVTEKNEQIDTLQAEINYLLQDTDAQNIMSKKMSELNMLIRRRQHAEEQVRELQMKSRAASSNGDYLKKITVLTNANVVLSTLSSCRQRILEKSFGLKANTHFTCCIVDEATQCTEPEVLQPLCLGLCKFILVGDHQQLPATVYSKLAIDCNYERSMFERLHLYFEQNETSSPLIMLTDQYRMHPEICAFPSAHFYSGQLVTKRNPSHNKFPLKPFIILNILYSQESNSDSSKTNVDEAYCIVELCRHLVKLVSDRASIGIITPYQAQRSLYSREFAKHSSIRNIELNTVDGFQGREKDLIIVSCVRAKSFSGGIGFLTCKKRLNVAITRARHCLIICGHMNSFKNDPNWTSLLENANRRKCEISVTDPRDISLLMDELKR